MIQWSVWTMKASIKSKSWQCSVVKYTKNNSRLVHCVGTANCRIGSLTSNHILKVDKECQNNTPLAELLTILTPFPLVLHQHLGNVPSQIHSTFFLLSSPLFLFKYTSLWLPNGMGKSSKGKRVTHCVKPDNSQHCRVFYSTKTSNTTL